MDILVCIPPEEKEHVMATKLNPISKLTHGYWILSGHPKFIKCGDRIWFAIYGEVIASARILFKDLFPSECDCADDEPKDGKYEKAVCFDIPTAMGHESDVPSEYSPSFGGFRYVRRSNKHISIKHTKSLEPVYAERVRRVHPRNW